MIQATATQSNGRQQEQTRWQRLFKPLQILGTPAPVFPGYEIDIRERMSDDQKPDAVWHRDRARAMLKAHPEIKEHFTRNRTTALWCLAFAFAQVGVALALAGQPWYWAVAAAFVVGAWINICLFNLAHDCNHALVFKSVELNRWLFTATSLPMFLPGHHSWWIEHHVHHNDLGSPKDFIVRRRQILVMTRQRLAFFITGGWILEKMSWISSPLLHPYSLLMVITQFLRSAIGLVMYFVSALFRLRLTPSDRVLAVLADEHLISGYEQYGTKRWGVVYPLLSFALAGGLFYYGGWIPLLYLLMAQVFMTGFLHPVMFGLILSNSHFHGHEKYQPSSSYYGWLNWITFNFGLHTEHHDLASVPWNRLPQLRRIAPEFYDGLVKTPSYSWLALKFTFCCHGVLHSAFINPAHENQTAAASEPTPS